MRMQTNTAPATLSLLLALALVGACDEPSVPWDGEDGSSSTVTDFAGSESGGSTETTSDTGTEDTGYMPSICCACTQQECVDWDAYDGAAACMAYGAAIGSWTVFCDGPDVTTCLSQCP